MRGAVWLVALAAGGMQLYWLHAWRGAPPDGLFTFLLLLVLGVLAQHFPVAVAPARKLDVAAAPYFAAVLLLGAPGAVALVGLSQLLGQLTLALRRNPGTGKRRRTVRSALFNSAQAMVATGLSAVAFYALVPHEAPAPLSRWEHVLALPVAAVVLYLANSLAVAGMVGLQLGANPLRVWRQGRKQGALEFAGLFLLGTVLARAGARDPLIVAVLCLPMAIVYWSLERTVRVEELARREAALTAWRDLEQLKSDFMRSVSHELRTPLSLVLGFAELLRDRARQSLPPDADAAECAEQIHANARLLARLVDDLLDFASIERGEITLQPRDYDLAAALADLVAGLRRQPGGERLVARLPAHLPVHADPARVAQAVYNLIANAQKYAPGGPITVRAALAQSQVDGPLDTVRIEVEDEGPGIPADEQPRVWEKFYRGRAVSGLNLATGTGIGLALVKTLTEAQRGRVGVRSAPGRGARFWIELPAADLPPAHAAAQGTSHSPVVVRLAGGSPPA